MGRRRRLALPGGCQSSAIFGGDKTDVAVKLDQSRASPRSSSSLCAWPARRVEWQPRSRLGWGGKSLAGLAMHSSVMNACHACNGHSLLQSGELIIIPDDGREGCWTND